MQQMWFTAALAVFLFAAYRLGFSDAAKILKGSTDGIIERKKQNEAFNRKEKTNLKQKDDLLTNEEEYSEILRLNRLNLKNIENYETNIPQQEVI